MKDKSRFLSSVIVSLLAGFIYLLAGEDLPVNIQSSVKAILSNNGPDKYLNTDCFPFYELSKNTGSDNSKNYSKFYLKNSETESNVFTEIVSVNQAKFIRPTPDKNIDFTSELQKLIHKNTEDITEPDLSDFINTTEFNDQSCNELQVAEDKGNFINTERIYKNSIKIYSAEEDKNEEEEICINTDEENECDIQIFNSDSDCSLSITNNCNKNTKVNKSAKIINNNNNLNNRQKVISSVKSKGNKTFVKVYINDEDNECDESFTEYIEDEDHIELPD
jgi:hypothetical protein